MQETNPRAGRAAPQTLSHKQAAAELEVGAELSSAPNAARQGHLCPKAPREELQITNSWVCFHSAPRCSIWGDYLALRAELFAPSKLSSELCSGNLGFYCLQKAQSESQEESKGEFKLQTHSPVVFLQQGKLLLEERGSPSFSKTPTTT